MSDVSLADLRIIFPFTFKNFDKITTMTRYTSKQKEVFCFEEIDIVTEELRRAVQNTMRSGTSTQICHTYRLTDNSRSFFGLPRRKEDKVKLFTRTKEEYDFFIDDVMFHFFDTGVGYLVFEIQPKNVSFDKLAQFNYFISEVKSSENIIKFEEKKDKDTVEKKEVLLLDLVKNLTKNIEEATDFDNSKGFHYSENRPMIYAHYFVDKDAESIENIAKNLALNYKDTYKVNRENIKSYAPFENSKWYFSSNVAVNITSKTDDEKTNEFMTTNFINKISTIYYLLFVLAVNQKYSMQKYLDELSITDRINTDYEGLEKQLDYLNEQKDNCLVFKYKNMFSQPSSVTQINKYYECLIDVMGIDKLEKYLDSKIELMIKIIDGILTKKNQLDSLKKEKKQIMRNTLLIFLTSVLTFASLYDTALKFIENINVKVGLVANIIIFFILLVCCLIIPSIFNIDKNVSRIKEINKLLAKSSKMSGEEKWKD